jgi:hypothetical protein
MNKNQTSNPHESAPKKLYKPQRELSDLRPEQVITYVDDGPPCPYEDESTPS